MQCDNHNTQVVVASMCGNTTLDNTDFDMHFLSITIRKNKSFVPGGFNRLRPLHLPRRLCPLACSLGLKFASPHKNKEITRLSPHNPTANKTRPRHHLATVSAIRAYRVEVSARKTHNARARPIRMRPPVNPSVNHVSRRASPATHAWTQMLATVASIPNIPPHYQTGGFHVPLREPCRRAEPLLDGVHGKT